MDKSSKKHTASTNNPERSMLWIGVLIGAIVAIAVIGVVLLITRKSDADNPYLIKNGSSDDTAVSNTAYDIAMAKRVMDMLPIYRSNNKSKFPPASKCRVGDTPLNELKDEDGVKGACMLIKSYLNAPDSESNEFVDADGKPYNLIILPSRVLAHDEPHTFYIYPNGRCGNDKVIISDDSYAVSYKASDDADLICVEESLNAYYTIDE